MSELFCKRFSEWVKKETGYDIDNDFYQAINDRDIELVYIMKRDPEWLADRFSELCKKEDPNYEKEIKEMLMKFKNKELNDKGKTCF